MNLAPILSGFACLGFICLGLSALSTGRKALWAMLYAVMCIGMAMLALLYLYLAILPIEEHPALFFVIMAAILGLTPALLLHAAMLRSDKGTASHLFVLIYVPVAAFIARSFETRPFGPSLDKGMLSWTSGAQYNEIWQWAYILYFALYTASALIVFLRFSRSSVDRYSQGSMFIAISAMLAALFFIATTDSFLPGLDRSAHAAAALLIMMIWLSFMLLAVSARKVEVSNNNSAFDEILKNMSDMVIILDAHGRVARINRQLQDALGYYNGDIKGLRIIDIASDPDAISPVISRLYKGFAAEDDIRIGLKGRNGDIADLFMRGAAVRGASGTVESVIIVGRRERSAPEPGQDNAASLTVLTGPAEQAEADQSAAPEIIEQAPSPAAVPEKEDNPLDDKFRRLVEQSLVGIFIFKDGVFTYVNPKMSEIFGFSPEDLIGNKASFDKLVVGDDQKMVREYMQTIYRSGPGGMQFSFRGMQKDGSVIDIEAHGTNAEFEGETVILGSLHEITERKMMEEAMRYQALHDPLTSLPNRMLFSDRVENAMSKAIRDKQMIAVMFLDLDRFKGINDTMGHNIGDMLLQSVAGVLTSCLRDSDTVARLGGDEFTVMLADVNTADDAMRVARKILAAINQKWNLAGHKLHLTTSMGLSLFPQDGRDAETLIRKADTAMYHAKALGGNTVRLYETHMDAGSAEQIQLENDLRVALDKNEFFVFYQPQFDLAARRVSGVEALLRWNHPERGLILPEKFIPLAEKSGIIVPIGEWVLRQACLQVKQWQGRGHTALKMAVNVSGVQLNQADFVESVHTILTETALSPHSLKLEITETVALQNLENIVPKLLRLTDSGVQFAIDDFGMGYSSLHYLKRLPIKTIKIDKSFMRDLARSEEDASIVTAVVAMAKSLKLDTIAEGVETADQLAVLSRCRCDKMQGFLYSQPLSASAVEALLR